MPKLRVYQLAKELQVQSALVLELLDRMGQDVRSDLSVLENDVAELVRDKVTRAIAVERKRIASERKIEAEKKEKEPAVAAEAVAAAPDKPEPAVESPAAPAPPIPTTPAAPVMAPRVPAARKPRVFPARRLVPHPSVRTAVSRVPAAKTGPVGARPPVPGAARPLVPGAARPPGTLGARPQPPGGLRPRRRKKDRDRERHTAQAPTRPKPELPPVPEQITLSEVVTVKELAEKLNRKSKDVIAKLIVRGTLATINQPLDPTVAVEVAKDFGSEATIISFEEESQAGAAADVAGPTVDAPTGGEMSPRPPIVTVMGHVDHGKTSLLDALRSTEVAAGEAGGITQHIGAYQIETKGRSITFLDTPGHEAFTTMRSRGSKATDIVVLVVAADDGVKPQTIEAIEHARAAKVPLVVAINKIDKPNAQPDRVKQQLAEQEVVIEEYGGDTVACQISAKQKTGLDELMEMILLVADLHEITADAARPGTGVVLETRLDKSRGIASTVLIQDGTLRVGDPFIAGSAYGKVRAMTDEHGHRVQEAPPSTPVEITGFSAEPTAGDAFQAVGDEGRARHIAAFRREKLQAERQLRTARRTLESLSQEVASGQVKQLPVILKSDFQGSAEALQKSLADLPSDKIQVRVISSSIGSITRADILLASTSDALIVGFNVRPDRATSVMAKQEGVELRLYSVIYDMIDDVKQAMLGMLDPTIKETVNGQAEVRELFKVPKIGVVAGCYVNDGKVVRGSEVRLLRDSVVVYTGKVGSLRRFKDDVAEVQSGYECGIGIANYNDLKIADVIEFFSTEKIAAKSL